MWGVLFACVVALMPSACSDGSGTSTDDDAFALTFDVPTKPKDTGGDGFVLDVSVPDVICTPGQIRCDADGAHACNASGTAWVPGECDKELGLSCDVSTGLCAGVCADSALARSYIGCEYWATQTSNSLLFSGFHFAVAIASASTETADVVIRQGGKVLQKLTLAPGQLQTVTLPWVTALKGLNTAHVAGNPLDLDLKSALVPGGAFQIKSTRPITVSQFNPLEFEIPAQAECAGSTGATTCNSYTNDAAILLPVNALGTSYIVASLPSGVWVNPKTPDLVGTQPAFVTIVAAHNHTNVHIHARGAIRAGSGVPAVAAGKDGDFYLNAGDVLQLLTEHMTPKNVPGCMQALDKSCKAPATFDLTGSIITTDQPVEVIGGHDCANVPYDKRACDHVEETLTPLPTWGQTALVAAPQSIGGAATANGQADIEFLRVISGAENNEITAEPPMPVLNGLLLQPGDYVDLPLTATSVHLTGTGRLLVVQAMVGAEGVATSGSAGVGDPSLSLAVPPAQYRDNYTFLVPNTYTYDFINILAPMTAQVVLDGKPVALAQTPIGSTTYGVTRLPVAGGNHVISGSAPFGLTVYGYALYTSYMYPGGLNLQPTAK